MAYAARNNNRYNQFNNGRRPQTAQNTMPCPCDTQQSGNTPSVPDCARGCDNTQAMALAMAYVPWQHFNQVYEPEMALDQGTLFPELDKPFYGSGGGCR